MSDNGECYAFGRYFDVPITTVVLRSSSTVKLHRIQHTHELDTDPRICSCTLDTLAHETLTSEVLIYHLVLSTYLPISGMMKGETNLFSPSVHRYVQRTGVYLSRSLMLPIAQNALTFRLYQSRLTGINSSTAVSRYWEQGRFLPVPALAHP